MSNTIVEKINPNIRTNTEGLRKLIACQSAKLARLSIDDITTYLTTLQEMQEKIKSKKLSENLIRKIDSIKPSLDKKLKRILNKKELQDYQTLIELFVANFEEIQNFVASFITLYMLSVITYPHFSYSRYPDLEVKASEYNENLGIVKKSPEIWKLLDNSITTIEKFLK